MKQALFAAAFVAALAHPGAQGATYVANLDGSGGLATGTDVVPVPWTGQVTVVVDGAHDGTYTGATLESITVDTDVFDWSYTKGQTQVTWEPLPGLFLLVGPEPGASVSIADGRLGGVNLVYDDESNVDTMSGLDVSAESCRIAACYGQPGNYSLSGTLTPIPEPWVSTLLLSGLGWGLAAALRRRAA